MKFFGILFLLFAIVISIGLNHKVKIYKTVELNHTNRHIEKNMYSLNFLREMLRAGDFRKTLLEELLTTNSNLLEEKLYSNKNRERLQFISDSLNIKYFNYQSNFLLFKTILSNLSIREKRITKILIRNIGKNQDGLLLDLVLFNDFKDSNGFEFFEGGKLLKLSDLSHYRNSTLNINVKFKNPRTGKYQNIF